MQLTEDQKIKLIWLASQDRAGRFKTTNPNTFGFDDICWAWRLDGVNFTFTFRLFPKRVEFDYIEFTPTHLCCHVPTVVAKLEEDLREVLSST